MEPIKLLRLSTGNDSQLDDSSVDPLTDKGNGRDSNKRHAAAESKRMMTTLQLGLHWFPERGGGADRMYADLIAALPEHSVRCRGLIAGSERAKLDTGGRIRAFAPAEASVAARWLGMRAAVRQEISVHRPDLVASHFAFYASPVLRVIQRERIPFAVHFQGPWAGESHAEGASRFAVQAKRWIERRVYRQARRLIVLSDAFGEVLVRDYGIKAEKIRRVPPGIDTKRFLSSLDRGSARERLGWPTDRPIVLVVRRLVQRMGLENLIDAAVRVRKEVPTFLLLIAGKGPLTDALGRRIKDLGLQDHVRLCGFVPDDHLPIAYRAADLTVVPTVALEGFGLIVVESLASGTPVMVTPVGGLPEAVRDLSENLIMPGFDVSNLAASLIDALKGRLPLPTEEACRSFAVESYDWQVIAPKIRAVYEEAINSI